MNQIFLDDDLKLQNPDPIRFARGNPLSPSNPLRGGNTITAVQGVLTQTDATTAANVPAISDPVLSRLRPFNMLNADGLADGTEDANRNGVFDYGETNTSDVDDDDGFSDGQEDTHHNGAIDAGESDPNNAAFTPTAAHKVPFVPWWARLLFVCGI